MAKDIGQIIDVVAASSTPVTIGSARLGHTIINRSASTIYFREKDPSRAFIGTAAELIVLGASQLMAGEGRKFDGMTLEVVCATGDASVLEVALGAGEGTGFAYAGSPDGTGLVFSTVVITEAAAGVASLGKGATGEVVRLHALGVTMRGQGTVEIKSSSDAGATASIDLITGPITLGAGGGIQIPFNADPRGALTTIVDEYMSIVFSTAGGDGYAIISKGPA